MCTEILHFEYVHNDGGSAMTLEVVILPTSMIHCIFCICVRLMWVQIATQICFVLIEWCELGASDCANDKLSISADFWVVRNWLASANIRCGLCYHRQYCGAQSSRQRPHSPWQSTAKQGMGERSGGVVLPVSVYRYQSAFCAPVHVVMEHAATVCNYMHRIVQQAEER